MPILQKHSLIAAFQLDESPTHVYPYADDNVKPDRSPYKMIIDLTLVPLFCKH
jgi:hypothetical protein